ncbi:MAG: lactate dehydrogenase [Oscillibacter sp.]
MFYYQHHGTSYAALSPSLPLERVTNPPVDAIPLFLIERDPKVNRASFCVSDSRQLVAAGEDVSWLAPERMGVLPPLLPRRKQRLIHSRSLRAVNISHPRWETMLTQLPTEHNRKRVHLLAVGDVGGTLLTALKLLGGDCIDTIGIYDLNANGAARWASEMNQISWPWDYDALPKVEILTPERLFDCDLFIFAATKAVPAVDSGVSDVRMAQFAANRPLMEQCARQARAAQFNGLFAVLSDPVDPLCQVAYQASNQDENGQWDGMGLLPERIQGYGLGVMNARAADLAQREPRFRAFLEDGRCFGPHGHGLIVANSIQNYDDALSRELTELTETANLRIRELGFKPFVAPAIASGAMQLLLTLRGQWHYSSVALGGIWFGARNRFTPFGQETESLTLPEALFQRLQETETQLHMIL